MHNQNRQKEINPKAEEMRIYLVQQGFFQDELKLPEEASPEMNDLFSCARRYLNDKNYHRHNPLLYLEAISYCVLRRSYQDLEEAQKKALEHFAEVIGSTARSFTQLNSAPR